ncbi:hypothetical protein [Vibrio sp. ER1A]|uniref:hypothetical protein n=1 Tax=Vibrio sp. ER1A TaxID=1517681 RepID=UPI001267CA7F|nr:hypothetical protein [Vibrio sp. ER1A]
MRKRQSENASGGNRTYFYKVERDTPEHLKIDEEVDKGHSRVEVRRCSALRVNEWIREADRWKGIQSIVKVREKGTF